MEHEIVLRNETELDGVCDEMMLARECTTQPRGLFAQNPYIQDSYYSSEGGIIRLDTIMAMPLSD